MMRALAALAVAALTTAAAHASGSTPPLQLPEENLESYAVCLATLKTVHDLDAKRLGGAPVTRDDGSILSHSLTTDGVIETGPETATYNAEYGTTVSFSDEVAGQTKNQYSWERVALACTGGKLTGTTTSGFSQPSFEPVPIPPAAG